MTSSHQTTCPGCGGRAYWNTDDGITYCDNNGATGCYELARKRGDESAGAGMHAENSEYKPSDSRGGF